MQRRSRSIPFDQAVDYYDRTRALSPELQDAMTRLLLGELAGRGRCLEVGIGTGRVALDLHRAGVPMAGIDLSRPMLLRLVENAGGAMPFPVAVADATDLPLADRSVGAAVVSHVLHLIDPWEPAVAELARVVRPGGVVLVDLGGGVDGGPLRELGRQFWIAATGGGRPGNGVRAPGLVEAEMARLGFGRRALEPIVERRERTARQAIARLDRGESASCWSLTDEQRGAGTEAAHRWAVEHLGSVDAPVAVDRSIAWTAYDAPD